MVRVDGIEPTTSAWKADVLPLNYTRIIECAYDAHHCANGSRQEFREIGVFTTINTPRLPTNQTLWYNHLKAFFFGKRDQGINILFFDKILKDQCCGAGINLPATAIKFFLLLL